MHSIGINQAEIAQYPLKVGVEYIESKSSTTETKKPLQANACKGFKNRRTLVEGALCSV
jgi:hypothetical protein